jgi:hypothetical protein
LTFSLTVEDKIYLLEKKIKFISPFKGFIPDPKPASFFIPKEYKEMKAYATDTKKYPTIKKCIPFLDSYTTGYIIPLPVDIEYRISSISPKTGETQEAEFGLPRGIPDAVVNFFNITEHLDYQASVNLRSPNRTIDKVFKFNNPWKIKTPPGYSSIISTPLNHNLPFDLISAIVDTDNYDFNIKFPFYWTADPNKSFLIKKGTPWVSVIPFKRDSWQSQISYESVEENENVNKYLKFFSNMANNYKNKSWIKKSFK